LLVLFRAFFPPVATALSADTLASFDIAVVPFWFG
jgi:hypothetical protein